LSLNVANRLCSRASRSMIWVSCLQVSTDNYRGVAPELRRS
jgi:hypothetical protein